MWNRANGWLCSLQEAKAKIVQDWDEILPIFGLILVNTGGIEKTHTPQLASRDGQKPTIGVRDMLQETDIDQRHVKETSSDHQYYIQINTSPPSSSLTQVGN